MLARIIPQHLKLAIRKLRMMELGRSFASSPKWDRPLPKGDVAENDLKRFFDGRLEGRGIWKWNHYFEAYDRHLSKFRGKPITIVEIGIFSGGSLDMWRAYFGPEAKIVGVDIEPTCKRYEGPGVSIFIGDQSSRSFWAKFRDEIPSIDIVIDDGGHEPNQQRVTLEELLPYMNSGGVFICEDIHGQGNDFGQYAYGLADALNGVNGIRSSNMDAEKRVVVPCNSVQSLIGSVSMYPFLLAVELREGKLENLVAPKHGTLWEPFLK